MNIMEENHKVKSIGPQAYRTIHKTITKKVREVNRKWMRKCSGIEERNNKHDMTY